MQIALTDPSGLFEVKIVEDSVSIHAVRLTTFQLRYPRFVHSEIMTHRVFSRNASSSRAIPIRKMIQQVRESPAMPVHWGKNQTGMQAREELQEPEKGVVKDAWMSAARAAANLAELMDSMGAHKQVANRILEPFQFMHTIISATDWDNFWELRVHEDAEPNLQRLASMMLDGYSKSQPVVRLHDPAQAHLDATLWHLPYVTAEERREFVHEPVFLAKLSAARCARVSYLNHEGKIPGHEEDLKLYERLVGSHPLHASPVEHQAYAVEAKRQFGNFRGWAQRRKFIEAKFDSMNRFPPLSQD